MQRILAPPIHFTNSRFEVYGRTIPQDALGGDLADLVASDFEAVAYVADVSGHGTPAGVLMGMVKTAARYGLMFGQPFPELLEGINRVLPSVKEPFMYATFAGLRLGIANEVEYAIAGNMPVLHYRESRHEVVRLSMEQFPLGLFPSPGYASNKVRCDTGDLFALFTDGLVETADAWEEQFGLNRLEAVLRAYAGRPLSDIYRAALDAVGRHGSQTDDRTLMLVRIRSVF
jgi:sigma-B regulation protein RsbU (phosphoserine phosphatase)